MLGVERQGKYLKKTDVSKVIDGSEVRGQSNTIHKRPLDNLFTTLATYFVRAYPSQLSKRPPRPEFEVGLSVTRLRVQDGQ